MWRMEKIDNKYIGLWTTETKEMQENVHIISQRYKWIFYYCG